VIYCVTISKIKLGSHGHQWRINHEAMEARASGRQFLGQKIGPITFRLSSYIYFT